MKRILVTVISLCLMLGLAFGAVSVEASPATIVVPDDQPTIQQGVDAASSGDTVYVRSGTYYEHVTIDKSLTLQGEDRETTIIDGGGSGKVIYVTANHVTISGLTVTNGENGIHLIPNWSIHHITVRDVIITSNSYRAFWAGHSGGYHLIEDCIISDNGGASYAHQFGNSIIRNCEVFGNGGGFSVAWGSGTLITNNRVHDNGSYGIWFDSMSYSTMEKNEVYNNLGSGIGVGYVGRYNTLRDNIVHHNLVGIEMNYPPVIGNKVYHNALIDNTLQVRELGSNIWDNGYPSGGNYWSDYTGVDDYSGPGQNLPGSDGIGDTPYAFIGNQDNYPLMEPGNGVPVDIKPTSCPNPLNVKSKGVLPVAILGTDSFDATQVDPSTITLQCVAPIRWAIADVAAPYSPYIGKESCQNCTIAGPDGYSDLTLKFDAQAIVDVLGEAQDGDCVKLTITGWLKGEFGGSPIIGEDLVWILKKGKGGG